MAVTWNSSNPTVAMVNNGVVTAKGAGKTIITAMTENNLKATCEVTVQYTFLQILIRIFLFGFLWY